MRRKAQGLLGVRPALRRPPRALFYLQILLLFGMLGAVVVRRQASGEWAAGGGGTTSGLRACCRQPARAPPDWREHTHTHPSPLRCRG